MSRQPQPNRTSGDLPSIDPIWLLKALGISFAVALVLAFLTLTVYFRFRDRHPQPNPATQQQLRHTS